MDTQLYDLVATTPLGEFIDSETFTSHPGECLKLYQLYLRDFISCVYSTTRDDEIEVEMTLLSLACAIFISVFSWFTKQLIQMCRKLPLIAIS